MKKIHSYYVEQNGFLMPAYLKFSNLFQDSDDYVLTASLLKTNIEDDIIMFDGEGKIIGISQTLYKNHIQRYSPNLTLDAFQEKGYIFLFFPQILSLVYQHQHVIQDLNMRFVNEQPVLFYINDDLQDMCVEFQSTQYQAKMDAKENQSSFNISTWRSRVSNRVLNEAISQRMSEKLQELDEVNNGKIMGVPIPLLNHDKASIYLDFCSQYFKVRSDHSVIRVKLSLQYRSISVKEKHYPYFLMEVNFINTYDQQIVKSSRLMTIDKTIERVRNGIIGQQKSLNKFDDVQICTCLLIVRFR